MAKRIPFQSKDSLRAELNRERALRAAAEETLRNVMAATTLEWFSDLPSDARKHALAKVVRLSTDDGLRDALQSAWAGMRRHG